jgi:hypothetical protein
MHAFDINLTLPYLCIFTPFKEERLLGGGALYSAV